MNSLFDKHGRRTLLKLATGAALINLLMAQQQYAANPNPCNGTGKPGDFDFLTGEWRIENRRLKKPDGQDWDEFEGEATVYGILNGICSIEELRIPARNFSGMGLRLLNIEKGIWHDHWVNAKSPAISSDSLVGEFQEGVGTFIAEEETDGKTLVARGVWDEITKDTCRWYQSSSTDGGKTWKDNWIMRWHRKNKH